MANKDFKKLVYKQTESDVLTTRLLTFKERAVQFSARHFVRATRQSSTVCITSTLTRNSGRSLIDSWAQWTENVQSERGLIPTTVPCELLSEVWAAGVALRILSRPASAIHLVLACMLAVKLGIYYTNRYLPVSPGLQDVINPPPRLPHILTTGDRVYADAYKWHVRDDATRVIS